VDNGT
jgi:transposase InsO family protein